MDTIRPLRDSVMIRRLSEPGKTAGGVIIPDSAKEKPVAGEVVAVGSGKVQEDGSVRVLQVKVGDRVFFGKFSGVDVMVGGEERVIVREEEILGVVAD